MRERDGQGQGEKTVGIRSRRKDSLHKTMERRELIKTKEGEEKVGIKPR